MAYETTQENGQTIALPLGARAEVLPASPVSEFRFPGGPCYAARFKRDTNAGLIAVICTAEAPPRYENINAMRNIDHPGLLKLVDSGTLAWPADGIRRYGLAYTRPAAPLLAQSLNDRFPAIAEDAVTHHFIAPVIGALRELSRVGAVHHGIRTTNIYWRPGSAAGPQLGEFLSAPAGFGQSALFEPIERGLCTPIGRGVGTHADDCYAFGVTLALLLLGGNPLQQLDEQGIVQAKIDQGSFTALVGNSRIAAAHIELLRGLLADDPRQRWTAADLEQWHNGRRLTPKSSDAGRRATRHIDFNGKEYWQTRHLAQALARDTVAAARLIEDGTIDKWLRRAAGDEATAERLAAAKASLKENPRASHLEDQLVARACIALDPAAPIRYGGVAVLPAGLAPLLAEAGMTGQSPRILAEIISSQLITFWVDMQTEARSEILTLGQQYERIRPFIDRISLGNGFERVLYDLNPGLPCLSPIVKNDYVVQPKHLLAALERVAKTGNRGREPMDRHIAAFLVVRDRRSEMLFDAMAAPDGAARRGIAMITLFADMQTRYGPDALPALAQWLLPLLEQSTRRFIGNTLRAQAQAQLKEAAQQGNLGHMLRLIDDPKRIAQDQQEFVAARMLYLNIMKEIIHLEKQLADRDSIAQSVGRPIALTVSSFLAFIFVLVALVRILLQALL